MYVVWNGTIEREQALAGQLPAPKLPAYSRSAYEIHSERRDRSGERRERAVSRRRTGQSVRDAVLMALTGGEKTNKELQVRLGGSTGTIAAEVSRLIHDGILERGERIEYGRGRPMLTYRLVRKAA